MKEGATTMAIRLGVCQNNAERIGRGNLKSGLPGRQSADAGKREAGLRGTAPTVLLVRAHVNCKPEIALTSLVSRKDMSAEAGLILLPTFTQRVRQFSLWQPLAVRDFRLLWLGQSVSLFGDQFYLIALPWLTLRLTGSAIALGTVLMIAGGTRAVFQLLGGALSDSVSPKLLMVASSVIRAVVTALIAVVVLLGMAFAVAPARG